MIENGFVEGACFTNFSHEAYCTVSCNTGYYMVGGGTVTCEDIADISNDTNELGVWNTTNTSCHRKYCILRDLPDCIYRTPTQIDSDRFCVKPSFPSSRNYFERIDI